MSTVGTVHHTHHLPTSQGAIKGKFASANMIASGFYMLLNGSLAAASSYLIGWGLETLVPE